MHHDHSLCLLNPQRCYFLCFLQFAIICLTSSKTRLTHSSNFCSISFFSSTSATDSSSSNSWALITHFPCKTPSILYPHRHISARRIHRTLSALLVPAHSDTRAGADMNCINHTFCSSPHIFYVASAVVKFISIRLFTSYPP